MVSLVNVQFFAHFEEESDAAIAELATGNVVVKAFLRVKASGEVSLAIRGNTDECGGTEDGIFPVGVGTMRIPVIGELIELADGV